jgi:glycosyltransferase involved in cell wall biosynthesis
MSPRLAVIIPVYNHARFIGEALESVLSQTRKPDRVIVIDDGSKDGSLAAMEPFKARGVEISGRENRGAHNTLNELVQLAAADCDWVSILNSDDRYLPGRFAECFATAERHPGKSIITTRLDVIDAEGNRMSGDEPRARWFYGVQSLGDAQELSPAEWMGRGNFVATTSNVFAKTAYLLANPFRPYRFNHDYFFLAGAAWRDQIACSPEVLLHYRVHGANTISTKPEPLIREMLRMHLDLYHHYAGELKADPAMRQRFYLYSQALWENMSSLHAGLLQVLLAQLAQNTPPEALETLAASLQGPEFDVSPNRTLAGAYDGKEPLSAAVLSRKLDLLRATQEQWRAERSALSSLARLRGRLVRSRWVSLGNTLCLSWVLRTNDGGNPIEKLANLKNACLRSWWLRLGSRLGSSTARQLLRKEFD